MEEQSDEVEVIDSENEYEMSGFITPRKVRTPQRKEGESRNRLMDTSERFRWCLQKQYNERRRSR